MKILLAIIVSIATASAAMAQAYYGPYTYPYAYAPAVIVPPQAYNDAYYYHRDLWGLGTRCDSFCQQRESDRVLLGR